MKYKFEFQTGNLADGLARLEIVDGQAEVVTEDEKALALRNGGVPVDPEGEEIPAPPEVVHPGEQFINLDDGVNDDEARTAGQALWQRRKK